MPTSGPPKINTPAGREPAAGVVYLRRLSLAEPRGGWTGEAHFADGTCALCDHAQALAAIRQDRGDV